MNTGLRCLQDAITGDGAIGPCLRLLADQFAIAEPLIWVIVLVGAAVSSIAGFAFAGIAGALLFHVTQDKLYTIQVILVASTALQSYGVWALRHEIDPKQLVPYFAGGMATILPGIYLFLNVPSSVHLLSLGLFLVAYAVFILARPQLRFHGNSLLGRVICGALGGITGATAAFPGAFVTIWCSGHGWNKERQRAIYQPFILGMQILILAAYVLVEPWHAPRPEIVQFALPALTGAVIGLRIFQRLSSAQFQRVIGVFLFASGIALSFKALAH